jgi:hypothetical protein
VFGYSHDNGRNVAVAATPSLSSKKGSAPMRLAVLTLALMLVTASAWTSALAQGSPSDQTPVGHRQPKASEVPQEQQQLSDPNKKMKELDDALAKKLKGICRGC